MTKLTTNINEIVSYCEDKTILAVDTETTGLDYTNDYVILFQIGDKNKQFLIDTRETMIDELSNILTSNNIYPLNLYFHAVGMLGWFIVAMLWNDHALIVINSVSIVILLNGILNYYVK